MPPSADLSAICSTYTLWILDNEMLEIWGMCERSAKRASARVSPGGMKDDYCGSKERLEGLLTTVQQVGLYIYVVCMNSMGGSPNCMRVYTCLLVVSVLPFVLRMSGPLPHDRAVSVLPT